ncbi:MAG: hypothetical protein HUJ31_03440, partial [Pseudomonadales bacterium]|nr:hypothetical protein [Pseudomonadales bacterium]
DDRDVEAPGTLTVGACNDTIIGTTSDFDIHHVKVDGDLRLSAASGSITDMGTGSEAAISAFGDVYLTSGTNIKGVGEDTPLRLQVTDDSLLTVTVSGELLLKQVSEDLMVGDDFDAYVTTGSGSIGNIDDLNAYSLFSGGHMDVEVVEGNLYLGTLRSNDSIDLTADVSVLDYFNDADMPITNILTDIGTSSTATGDVNIYAGQDVGTGSNYVDVDIRQGDLNGVSGHDTFINSVRGLNIGDYESEDGNVTLTIDGKAEVGLITALGDGSPDADGSLSDGVVTIKADTFVEDDNDNPPTSTNVTNIHSTGAVLIATNAIGSGIGSSDNRFDLRVERLEASVEAGGIWIRNEGDAQVGNIASGFTTDDGEFTALSGISASDTVDIQEFSTLTVNEEIDTDNGPVLLDAAGGLVINAGILSGGGYVRGWADDDIEFGYNVPNGATGYIDSESGNAGVTLVADENGDGSGGIYMDDGTWIDAVAGVIDLDANDNIVVSLLQTDTDVLVTSDNGAILDNTGESIHIQDIIANQAILIAASGIGHNANEMETTFNYLEAEAGIGGIFIDD